MVGRYSGLGPLLGLVVSAWPMAQAQAQVDLSCIGVQAMSAAHRASQLGANAAAYAPVLERIRNLQDRAIGEVTEVEKRWKDALNAELATIRAADPGLSDESLQARLNQRIRQSADLDNKLADLLVAQLKAHRAEVEIILEGRKIPSPDNARQVADLARRHAEARGMPRELIAKIQNDVPLQQLVGILASATAAEKSSRDIPAGPLAFMAPALGRLGYDTSGVTGNVVVVEATQAAARLVAAADSQRTGQELIVDHLRRLHGSVEDRRAAIDNPKSEAAKVTSRQIGGALVEFQKSNATLRRSSDLKINVKPPDKPDQHKAWMETVASTVKKEVQIITEYVYGIAPPAPEPSREPK